MFTVDGGTSNDVRQAIVEKHPKLENIGFELMRAIGGGGSGKPLIRLDRDVPIPDCSYIKQQRVTVVYIRPFEEIVEVI